MIEWLRRLGVANVVVLDNASTYPPLLQYYQDAEANKILSLIRLEKNVGPWGFWQLDLHKKLQTPYVVTDSDLIPHESCPDDILQTMLQVLLSNPTAGKVGPGLVIDDLPTHYRKSELVYAWEQQFWHQPIARGLFRANIDTTFAIYPQGSAFNNQDSNIRLGYPYLMRHTPWYIDDSNLDEEEIFYRDQTCPTFSHWSSDDNNQKLKEILANKKSTPPKTILHLGCGNDYIPGWINLDISGRKLDITYDLDKCGNANLPIASDSIDGFYMCHAFGRIANTLPLMTELYRVPKSGAKIFIRMPYGSSDDAQEDPTLKRVYFEGSFLYFSQPTYSRVDYGYRADWQPEKITLVVPPNQSEVDPNETYKRIKTQRNQVREMIVELRAVKPARPRSPDLLRGGAITITDNRNIHPDFA